MHKRKEEEDESIPDLVALQVMLDETIEEFKLLNKIRLDSDEGVSAILPIRFRIVSDALR
jgi:hypothetical protein